MFSKFFTFVFLCFSINSFGQSLVLKNSENGTEKKVCLNRDIDFELYSDSILSTDFMDDGKLISYADSSLVLQGEREINFSDIKTIWLYPKNRQKAKTYAAPFLVLGLATLGKGLFMLGFEGMESKNKQTVPLYLGIGTLITGVSSLPFWGHKKKYKMSHWGFVLK
ncbi:MAG: hypothetical protein ACJA0Q_000717 [Saprospiraceae bacterium]|jgi:hypothetical protein